MKLGLASQSEQHWAKFTKKYQSEMKQPDASRTLDLLAALLHTSAFSVGCYCHVEARCHRPLLRKLLESRDAMF